jgi:hypothetical protein
MSAVDLERLRLRVWQRHFDELVKTHDLIEIEEVVAWLSRPPRSIMSRNDLVEEIAQSAALGEFKIPGSDVGAGLLRCPPPGRPLQPGQ